LSHRIVILAHAHDAGAATVARLLAERWGGDDAVVRLRPELLGLSRWSQRVDPAGRVSTLLRTPSGVMLGSEETVAVLDRLRYLPAPRFARARPKDREYAGAELHALVKSWLAGLGRRVVNPVGPCAPGDGPRSPLGWLALGRECGLPVARIAVATTGGLLDPARDGELLQPREPWPGGHSSPMPVDLVTVEDPRAAVRLLVAGDRVLGPVSDRVAAGARELARRSGMQLLELRLRRRGLVLTGVDPTPPLDTPEAAALAVDLLEAVADEHPVAA
jgi:hypothetical protein